MMRLKPILKNLGKILSEREKKSEFYNDKIGETSKNQTENLIKAGPKAMLSNIYSHRDILEKDSMHHWHYYDDEEPSEEMKKIINKYGEWFDTNFKTWKEFDKWAGFYDDEDDPEVLEKKFKKIQTPYSKAFNEIGFKNFKEFVNYEPELDDNEYWLYPDDTWSDPNTTHGWGIGDSDYILAPSLYVDSKIKKVTCGLWYENEDNSVSEFFKVKVSSPKEFATTFKKLFDKCDSDGNVSKKVISEYFKVI